MDVAPTALERASLALDNILELVVHGDFAFMGQILADYLGVYVTNHEPVVDNVRKVLDEIIVILPSMVNESNAIYRTKVNPTAKARANFLVAFSDMASHLNHNPANKIIKDIPSRLVSDPLYVEKCQTLLTNMTEIIQNTILMEDSGISGSLHTIRLSDSDIEDLHELYTMHESNKCLSELNQH